MELELDIMDGGISRVRLRGRMDILGVQAIDMKFTALTATQAALVLVDMSGVSFLASLGMRTLISSAKALAQRGGHMVLANPQPNVLDVTGQLQKQMSEWTHRPSPRRAVAQRWRYATIAAIWRGSQHGWSSPPPGLDFPGRLPFAWTWC